MADNSGAGQAGRGAQALAGPKPLSCISCRQRKVKCNKTNPCLHCQKSGIDCVFPNRVPRGRKEGSGTRNAELLRRISRLESLVYRMDDGNGTIEDREETARPTEPMMSDSAAIPSKADASVIGTEGDRLDDRYARFIKQQERGTRYLSKDFWTSLSGEVDGLRQLLEHPEDDEEDHEGSTPNSTETKDSPLTFIFHNPGADVDLAMSHPSALHHSILFQIYFANVDPVFKVVHKPTSDKFSSKAAELLDPSSRRFKFGSLEAVAFAMYFAAVTSLSPEDCMRHFGEQRDVLVTRYRRSTERALAMADCLSSMELVTLQAFAIYTVSNLRGIVPSCRYFSDCICPHEAIVQLPSRRTYL